MQHCRRILTKPASRPSFHAGGRERGPSLRRDKLVGSWRRNAVARNGQPDPGERPLYRGLRSAAFFLVAQQAALDTSWMNLGTEAFLDLFHQIRQSNGRFFLAHLANE